MVSLSYASECRRSSGMESAARFATRLGILEVSIAIKLPFSQHCSRSGSLRTKTIKKYEVLFVIIQHFVFIADIPI